MSYGATIVSVRTPDRRRPARRRRARLRHPRRLPHAVALLRHDRRPLSATGSPRGASRSTAVEYQLADQQRRRTTCTAATRGFDKVVWTAEPFERGRRQSASLFTYTSADGEEGYPGKLDATVTYTLTPRQRAGARLPRRPADKATPVNLTNHSYFNLAGAGTATSCAISSRSTPIATRRSTTTLIPTGELAARRRDAVRLPDADRDRRADRRRRRAAAARQRLRPQLRAERMQRAAGALRRAARVVEPASRPHAGGARPPNRACSSTPATTSIWRATASATRAAASVSRRSTFPIRRTIRNFPSTILRPGETYRVHDRVHVWSDAMKRLSRCARAVSSCWRHHRRATRGRISVQLRRRDAGAAQRQRCVVVVHGSAGDRERRQADRRIGARDRQQRGERHRSEMGQRRDLRLRPRDRQGREHRPSSASRAGRSRWPGVSRPQGRPLPGRLQQAHQRAPDVLPDLGAAQSRWCGGRR